MRRILVILLIAVVCFAGCGMPQNQNGKTDDLRDVEVKLSDSNIIEKEIVLYFANSQAEFVVPELRRIKIDKDIDTANLAKIILQELIKGPQNENLYRTIPAEVKVLDVEIQEDTILIDFSKEMHTKHWGGAAGEDMTIASLANTLTELQGIKKVLPSVEGTALSIEHIIVDEPLERIEEKIYR